MPLSFLYHIDINTLLNNPYRDNLNDSFISITLLDMFGDYFERYWDHSRSLFMQDRFELDSLNLNLLRRRVASLLSFTFLFLSFKNKEFRLYKLSYLIGIFLILMTSLGVFGTYFNPDKADTVKTHYYSFLLALSFIFIVQELIKNKIILGGMIPKIKTCIDAVLGGAEASVIMDGRMPHSLLLELFTEHGVGTIIRKSTN